MREIDYYDKYGLFWQEKETDCRQCSCCGDMIYSKMFVLSFNGKKDIKETDFSLCQSCRDSE